MPSWHSLLEDVKVRGSVFDVVRREWLAKLAEYTGRNVIIYYVAFIQISQTLIVQPGATPPGGQMGLPEQPMIVPIPDNPSPPNLAPVKTPALRQKPKGRRRR